METERRKNGKGTLRRAVELLGLGTVAGFAAAAVLPLAAWLLRRCGWMSGDGGIPAETGPHAEWMPFLQGGTDWGGGAGYALTAAWGVAYLAIAAWTLSAWHAVEWRHGSPRDAGWLRKTLEGLWFFVPLAALAATAGVSGPVQRSGGPPCCSCEGDVGVLHATILLLGTLTAAWTAWLSNRRWRLHWKLLAAPSAVALWLGLAWDGQTPRAGQRLWSGQEPLPAVRSVRHAAMLAWHGLWVDRPRPGDENALLWFWTDGRNEFGTRRGDSPSARALRTREDLPWTKERKVFVVPIAADGDTPLGNAMPYQAQMRHFGGYFLQEADGALLPLQRGRIASGAPWDPRGAAAVDVHLPPGGRYWQMHLPRNGQVEALERTVDVGRAGNWRQKTEIGPGETLVGLDEVLAAPPLPVELWMDGDARLGDLAALLRRLHAAGFRDLFVAGPRR